MILLMLNSCASPKAVRFKARWDFCQHSNGETWACIDEADTGELRRILIECGRSK